jgi:extracellular elastinolytic metalloproteinase
MKNCTTLIAALLLMAQSLIAQSPEEMGRNYVQAHVEELGLSGSDVEELLLSDAYTDRRSGVHYVYFNQAHHGVPVHNGLLNLSFLPDGRHLHTGMRLVANLHSKVNSPIPALTPEQAIYAAVSALNLPLSGKARLIESLSPTQHRFDGGVWSERDIDVQLKYQRMLHPEEHLRLVWDLSIDRINHSDYWSLRIDAQTGQVLDQVNLTISCSFHSDAYGRIETGECDHPEHQHGIRAQSQSLQEGPQSDGAAYRVFAIPVESPSHGSRSLVVEPADPTASPFGWHDINGNPGAEYNHTRGNNVRAHHAPNATTTPPPVLVEGGANLQFDFPYNPALEPTAMVPAAITNLFYMNNILHDVLYQYGFDEQAGNFQHNHYGNGPGNGDGDAVLALGLYGSNDPEGLGAVNNASFATPIDGVSGTMRMYLWDRGARLLEVLEPAEIAGSMSTGVAQFGPSLETVSVSGQVVEVQDPVLNPFATDGCETPFVNAAALQGKIALIDRGGCFFQLKTKNAQDAGAIAVIICNFEDGTIGMAGTSEVPPVNIPTVMVGSVDCSVLRTHLNNGLTVYLGQPAQAGPQFVTSDFDNGIIAHEYVHGLSTRLTGGRFNSGCLTNPGGIGEQMGEGWSDFYGIALTIQLGDTGEKRRGVGTYAIRENTNGKGIRAYPYSTDMNTNPVTYSSIVSASVPHGVGHVWSSMLWDLFWAMVDEYGYDNDIYYGNGGNNMTLWLVTEAMKIQPCDPGFVDGRNAILVADLALFGGANQCLIWEVFARRGLGIHADQGFSYDHRDGTEDFTVLPTCIEELKITKSATELVEAGENIEYTLYVINHLPGTAENVILTDELAPGLTYVAGSASIEPASVSGGLIVWELGDMAYEQEITITYEATTPTDVYSIRFMYEDVEGNVNSSWAAAPIGVEAPNLWAPSNLFAYSGQRSFFVQNIASQSNQSLLWLEELAIQGNRPALRFYHRFETEPGADAGLVEVSKDFSASWERLDSKFLRGGYVGPVTYTTFTTPNLNGFWGNSEGWMASYIDLSDYAGEELLLRFRFGTDESVAAFGWFVDDIEYMDLVNYNSAACVSSNQSGENCAWAPFEGTFVESKLAPVATEETAALGLPLRLFPNPAKDVVNLGVALQQPGELQIRISSIDGRLVSSRKAQHFGGEQVMPISIATLPAGMYLVEVSSPEGRATTKLIID